MTRTLVWELVGPVFVIAQGETEPTDDDYSGALRGYAQHLGKFTGILVYTIGGAPNAAQRKATSEFWRGKELPVTVVMTSSAIARGAITALNWVLPQQMKAVKADDFAAAFANMNTPAEYHAQVRDAVARLRPQVSAPDRRANV